MSTPTKQSALANLKARRHQAVAGVGGTDSIPEASGGSPVKTLAAASSSNPKPPIEGKVSSGTSSPSPPPSSAAPAPSRSTTGSTPTRSGSGSGSRPTPAGGTAVSSAAGPALGPAADPAAGPLPTREVEAFAWVCNTCQRECVPVRSESRCLCGHRLREHDPASTKAPSRCKAAKCTCRGFFFVVAEGAWVLRCRCKHKHVEHDPATHACAKAGCSCRDFDSPWVCNCDHPWADHRQLVQLKQVVSVRDMIGGMSLAEVGGGGPAREVNDYSALKRGDFASQ